MIRSAVKVSILLLCQVICAKVPCAQEINSPGSPNQQVVIRFAALDNNHNLVNNIRAEDLKVSADGKTAKVLSVQQIKDPVLAILLLIDVSISQERTLAAQKLAASKFLTTVIKPGDKAAVATFTNDVQVEQQFTNNPDLLRTAVGRAEIVYPPGHAGGGLVVGPPPKASVSTPGSTAIWDNLVSTCSGWQVSSDPRLHRAVILLTDGLDTSSMSKISDAIQCMNRKSISVYSVGLGDSRWGVDKSMLRKLAEETGGVSVFPKNDSEMSEKFDQLGAVLGNYYLLTFSKIDSNKPFSRMKIELGNSQFKNVELSYQHNVSQ